MRPNGGTMKLSKSLLITGVALALGATSCKNSKGAAMKDSTSAKIEKTEHYTFTLAQNVTRTKVTFRNHFGIELAGDLYAPKDAPAQGKRSPRNLRPVRSGKGAVIRFLCKPDGKPRIYRTGL